jgi:uncharacterized membrane protein (UPF0127 family)
MPKKHPKKTASAPKRPLASLLVGIALVIGGLSILGYSLLNRQPRVIVAGDAIIVEVADQAEEQIQGLSNRQSLPRTSGMLFVFDEPKIPSFWMKDMQFNLDMIWINADGQIVDIDWNLRPETYPETFSPDSLVRYTLEVNGGLSDERGWQVGDIVEFKL